MGAEQEKGRLGILFRAPHIAQRARSGGVSDERPEIAQQGKKI